MPVFCTPLEFVDEAVASVEMQTARETCELIIWDDGSGPEYYKSLERLVSEHSTFPILLRRSGRNRGYAHARNAAAEIARGQWLLLLDSDDMLDPNLLESLKPALLTDANLLYTDHVFVDATGRHPIHVRRKAIYELLRQKFADTVYNPMLHATFIFHCQIVRATCFASLGGFNTPEFGGEEVELHLRIEELDYSRIRHVPTVGYVYRDNPTSVVHDQNFYVPFIHNIESFLVAGARRRGFDVIDAKRLGRSVDTHAAHYELTMGDGTVLRVPWFNYDELRVVET
jgi:glycosyltransferase involved in cell wall biosynthesis